MRFEPRLQRLEALSCRREIAEAIEDSHAPPHVTVDLVLMHLIAYLTLSSVEAQARYPDMPFSDDDRAEVRRQLPTFHRALALR